MVKQFVRQSQSYFASWGWQSFLSFFKDWTLVEKSWITIATIVVVAVASFNGHFGLSFIVAITGVWNNIFIAKGKIVNFIFGIINNALYAFISFQSGVYGQMLLFAIYFFPMQFVGWYEWTKPDNHSGNEIIAYQLTWSVRILLVMIVFSGTVIYGLFLYTLGENVAWLDALATIISMLAMWLMAKLYLEQWVCWITINVVSILLWMEMILVYGQGSYDIVTMWLIFLINAIYGYVHWSKLVTTKQGD